MLTYYNTDTTPYFIRVENILNNNSITLMYIENMENENTTSYPLIDEVYDGYYQTLSFGLNLTGVNEGEQYRAIIRSGQQTIWRGSIQVYTDQPVDKKEYETKLNSNTIANNNDYIILEN